MNPIGSSQQDPGRKRYLELVAKRPELFANTPATAIRILLDSGDILSVEEGKRRELAERALPASWADVGLVFEDQYIRVLRDAVEFPGGARGTYIRVLPLSSPVTGAAVLPVLDDKIVLVRHFRHATRAWHLEIPRGFCDGSEMPEETAARELLEEIGVSPVSLTRIGGMHTNTGLLDEYVAMFVGEINALGQVAQAEGIDSVRLLGRREVFDLIGQAGITDAFTLSALTLAVSHGLLPD